MREAAQTTAKLGTGVCVKDTDCSTAGDYKPLPVDKCPGLPDNVKFCSRRGCKLVKHHMCGGGPNVKWVIEYKQCWCIERGQCPGGDNYLKLVAPYTGPP